MDSGDVAVASPSYYSQGTLDSSSSLLSSGGSGIGGHHRRPSRATCASPGLSVDSPGSPSTTGCMCVCERAQVDLFMIQCDACEVWYHGQCVLIHEDQDQYIELFHCPRCRHQHGPLTLRNRPRFWEELPRAGDEPTRNGCQEFVRRLKQRKFDDPAGIPVAVLQGHEVTAEYLERTGFTTPIVVDRKDGLRITVPDASMTLDDIEELIGSMRELDVIDVAEQRERKMLLREWVDYFGAENEAGRTRNMTLNLISLEFSNTKMGQLVDPPAVVKACSWVDTHWPVPGSRPAKEAVFLRPEVQKYCLMSVKDSYTDFHVDFGGTSVWYHVLRGAKIFYLIRPTAENLARFEEWYQSAEQSETFLPDLIDDACYRCKINQGQTVFLPSGWIHAVLTPVDSVVFGGNFLHSFNAEMQLRVYAMERRTKTPEKYFFPNFETLHWYVAEWLCAELKRRRAERALPPPYLLRAARSLSGALQSWTRKDTILLTVPDARHSTKLVTDLQKLTKHWEAATADAASRADAKQTAELGLTQEVVPQLGFDAQAAGGGPIRRKKAKIKKPKFIF